MTERSKFFILLMLFVLSILFVIYMRSSFGDFTV